jgi:hypothetical protein
MVPVTLNGYTEIRRADIQDRIESDVQVSIDYNVSDQGF